MRWSLVFFIQAIALFATVSHAFPISPSGLETRSRSPISVSSKTYRKASQGHHYSYKVSSKGDVSRAKVPAQKRKAHGAKAIAKPKTDADHILEKQMVTKHLAANGPKGRKSFNKLPKSAVKEIKKIVNSPQNLAPISASINRSKGGKVKMGMQGRTTKKNKATERYMKATLPTARMVAKKIDHVYKKHGIKTKQSVDSTLVKTYKAAGILKKSQKPPPASPPNSPKGKGKAGKK